ncbi:MAG: MBL fold metallo-hydrolase [Candidatus Latescibacteria bacterium]|nr:MBL fold metallo-hydrolase [Candidatus Latescibacterota bacterium]
MHNITDRCLWVEGTCSTYIIRAGDHSLLIDCGMWAPAKLEQQADLGTVEQVWLTHFHRDQCGAAPAWSKAGSQLTFPFAEKRFFEEADLLRASYDIYDNYTSYFPGRGPLEDLRGEYACDYQHLQWRDLSAEIVPLPGHTFGSVGYLLEVDGQRLLACGDVLCGPGKLREYFWAQWRYMDFQGHINLLESLQRLRQLEVDWLLPGHGAPFRARDEDLAKLLAALEELYELFHGRPYQPYKPQFRRLSEHVHEVANSSANTYIVADGAGHGLLIDCGYTSNAPISANPHRFIDHLTPHLQPELGIDRVEWFLPSHYHDDHLAGLPCLQARYDTQVACSPELTDIMQHPQRYDMPCAVPHSSRVDQVVPRDGVFHWRGLDFKIEQFPGQTLYHHLIGFAADGVKYLSIGDNISGVSLTQGRDLVHSFIPKNRTPVSSYRDMPRQIAERAPDILLTGHKGALSCKEDQVAAWQGWMDRWAELFEDIIDQPVADMGMDPHWVEFYPYKVRVQPGEEVIFEVRVTNHEKTASQCHLRFVGTVGLVLVPGEAELVVAPGEVGTCQVRASIPKSLSSHSFTVVTDVTWNERRLGPIAEGVAYW